MYVNVCIYNVLYNISMLHKYIQLKKQMYLRITDCHDLKIFSL